jgi:hypothetical protein
MSQYNSEFLMKIQGLNFGGWSGTGVKEAY